MKAFLTSILLVAGVALAIGSNQMTPGPVPPKRVESNGGITVRYDGGAYGLYVDGGTCAGAGVSGPLCVSGPGGPSTLDAGMTLTDGDLTVNGHSSPNTGVIWLNLAHTKYIWFDGTLVQIGGVSNFSSVLNSSVNSGNVAIQINTGAKGCFGSGGLGCLLYDGTNLASSVGISLTSGSPLTLATATITSDGSWLNFEVLPPRTGLYWHSRSTTTAFYAGGVGGYYSAISTLRLKPEATDGSSAIAVSIDTQFAFSTAGSKLLSGKNNGTEKMNIDRNGSYQFVGNPTLDTCASGLEGEVSRDVLSGLATGKRTKLCLCTSDGASAYKWQNLATGTLGTTTTCGTE